MRFRLSVRVGIIYALTVFAIGYLLGAMRVLLLVPSVGPTVAVSIEAPIMLGSTDSCPGLALAHERLRGCPQLLPHLAYRQAESRQSHR